MPHLAESPSEEGDDNMQLENASVKGEFSAPTVSVVLGAAQAKGSV